MFVFTSCTNNYIPKARVLASTLKSFHPDWTFCLLLGEAPPANFILENEPFDRLVTFDQLNIPDFSAWLFRHRVVEICTAAKGPALHYFLEHEKHEKVMYLDPDIMVCNTLDSLSELLDTHDVLLTPHQLAPQETQQSIVDNELCALQYGVFNLGFVAAARRGDGMRFARWWRDRLLHYCYDDIPRGLFTDQRWCDLAPAFFPKLHIVRDPGCNAASWNLTDRTITRREDGVFFAENTPLRFYHFTGFDSGAGDGMTARYAKNMPAVHALWALYRERLMGFGHAALGKMRWAHMSFNDGTAITDGMRLLYREREDVRRAFPDPFAGRDFLDWYIDDQKIQASRRRRIRNKISAVRRKAMHVLNQHGGFPRGLPGAARQVASRIKTLGLAGTVKKIWNGSVEETPKAEELPLLRDVLARPEHADFARMFRILAPANAPICIFEHDWGGGADIYCRERTTALLDEGRSVISVCWRTAGYLELTARCKNEGFRCEVGDLHDLLDSRFPRIDGIVINELAGWYYQHDALHTMVNRIQDAVRVIIQTAKHHNAHVEFLFHDYFAVCPTTNLLTSEQKYCGLNNADDSCTACALRGVPFSMAEWRSTWEELLNASDEIVFFSENTRNTVGKVYPLRTEQIRIRPHTVKAVAAQLNISKNSPMRVAVVGNIQIHKGADIVVGVARLMEQYMPEASIIICGNLDAQNVPKNVTVLGQYKRDELAGLLEKNNVTVGLFPSIWPETFSFVIHELTALGLPLVAFNLGAQGDYVGSLAGSRLAAEISAEAAFACLQELDTLRVHH